ncbi:hypothetical protein JCM6882_000299 [Rhodosporidiobolus microsporus]
MAKSTTKKGKQPAAAPRAPSPAPSNSSSASPGSSGSSSSSDDGNDSDSSSSSSGRASSASPAPQAVKRVDPSTQKYSAPEGFKPAKASKAHEQLDWDELNDDKELELWAVRVPAGMKAKHLDGLTITLPDKEVTNPRQAVGHIKSKKGGDFDVFLAPGASSGKRRRAGDDDAEELVSGAAELQGLVPLVPRKSQGNKLYQAPRPIAHTLVINRALPPSVLASTSAASSFNNGHSTLISSQPSPVPGAILSAAELTDASAAKKRKEQVLGKTGRSQPSELLKFRLDLPGMKAVGGRGEFNNPPTAEEMEAMSQRQALAEAVEVSVVVAEDVEMGEAPGGEVVEDAAQAEEKKEKKRSKDKGEKKRKEKGEAGEKSPKKKRVKTE